MQTGELISLYQEGKTMRQLSAELGIGRGQIQRILRKNNIVIRRSTKKKPGSKTGGRRRKDFSEAIRLYQEERISLTIIAQRIGITRHALTCAFKRRNVKIHPRGEYRKVKRSSRRNEDRDNRLEWRKLQRSIAHIKIEGREEELERLIREQEIDNRTYQIKWSPSLNGIEDEVYAVEKENYW